MEAIFFNNIIKKLLVLKKKTHKVDLPFAYLNYFVFNAVPIYECFISVIMGLTSMVNILYDYS